MKLAFCWDWPVVEEQTITWQDGLAAALVELKDRGHDVRLFAPGDDNIVRHPFFDIHVVHDVAMSVAKFKPDAIIVWGDLTRPNIGPLRALQIPLTLCFAGGTTTHDNAPVFDHIFVESEVYREQFEDKGINATIAFGTNTKLFTPRKQTKTFDTIFPATFALWKRHKLYAEATNGLRSLAVGYMYDDHETECWQDCISNGVTVLPHVSAEALAWLYAASRVCVVPSRSDGGSQRTVLEAMAMNLPLIVTDSDKFDFAGERVYHCSPDAREIRAFVQTLLDGEPDVHTRDYILEHWSEKNYADALEEGLNALL